MWIRQVEIENFKSFFKPQVITFAPGFNLILGANNAGKSTVLQALDLAQTTDMPHRSVTNVTSYGMKAEGQSRTVVELSMSVQELRQMRSQATWYLPVPEGRWRELASLSHDEMTAKLLEESNLNVAIERCGNAHSSLRIEGEFVGSPWLSLNPSGSCHVIRLTEEADGRIGKVDFVNAGDASNLLWSYLSGCAQKVYRFDANRIPFLAMPVSESGHLASNASNLAACINRLSNTDPAGHKILCQWINRVLPHVHWVQAPAVADNQVGIECLPQPIDERRHDLAVPLTQMGSGVGNVLAALYVVLTARTPQVICIDEPSQFLHPKALRELLHILATEGKQHQFILTAHSGDVIGAVKAETVTLLTLDKSITQVRQTDHKGLATLRDGFAELGIRATELHGRDRVLWVEGQTEELVFPGLLTHFCELLAAGTAVLRVHATGDFEPRRVDPIQVVTLYTRLTSESALVPPMVAVVLDREGRPDEVCERLEADRRGRLRFLPRRMLENYLLHPKAIAQVLSELGEAVDVAAATEALTGHARDEWREALPLEKIDGAKVLAAVFSAITSTRQEFRKTRDVPALVDWLLLNDASFLRPLGDWLGGLLVDPT